jgi:AraC-like DNA-binding protein
MIANSADNIRRLYLKLLHSGLFKAYQKAFVNATGLPLVLRYADDPNREIRLESENQNPFCQLLNHGGTICKECLRVRNRLVREAGEKARTTRCFFGMQETAVPVRLGKEIVGFLETGQIRFDRPTDDDFEAVAQELVEEGRDTGEISRLHPAFLSSTVIDETRYHSMVTLLAAFSLQLSDLANRIVLERHGDEPAIVRTAKAYILAKCDGPIRLEDVARHVNVSLYYFCKLFKKATGMTFTEFVNRQRVERAKQMLLDPEERVTVIAYEVGFQSLSQFNRCFLKIVGDSPTEFRRRMRAKPQLAVA